MTKTREFESLNDVRQLLLNVERRKSNFDFNETLLERERDFRRLKSAWESIGRQGPEFERGKARYLVNKSIAANQSEIQKNVDKSIFEDKSKIEDPKGTKTGFKRGKSVPVRPTTAACSRLMRVKSSLCERGLKKSEQTIPLNKPKSSSKVVSIAINKMPARHPGPTRQIAVAPQWTRVLQQSSLKRHRFSTKSVLTDSAVKAEEERSKETFISLGIFQRNNIPTSCKATSTSLICDNESTKARNTGFESLQHPSIKPELKVQVLPSVHIKPLNDKRPFTNVRYVELGRNNDEPTSTPARRDALLESSEQPADKRPGKIPLTRELTEKIMAICEAKMMTDSLQEQPTFESQGAADVLPQTLRSHVDEDRGSQKEGYESQSRLENAEEKSSAEGFRAHNAGGEYPEACGRDVLDSISSETETSSAETVSAPSIPTPLPTPIQSLTPSPVHPSIPTPPTTRPPSPDESESGRTKCPRDEPSAAEIRAFTPEPSPLDSPFESYAAEITALSPEETEVQSEASPVENVVSKSSISSNRETDATQSKTEGIDSIRATNDFSIGQVPPSFYHGGKCGVLSESKLEGCVVTHASSSSDETDNFEFDADWTNATTYSEGEVRPFRLHRLRNFDEMLSLLNRAQASRFSAASPQSVQRFSLGQRGVLIPSRPPMHAPSSPGSKNSEKSLGEVEVGVSSKMSRTETKFASEMNVKWQESASEGEILRES